MDVIETIIEDLTEELNITEGKRFNSTLLQSKVKAAYNEVKAARKYPETYSDDAIVKDMESYYTVVRAVSLYDYNQIGAEGQTSYSGDGTSIHYVSRDSLFKGVTAIARL